jgi:hypothetical protein
MTVEMEDRYAATNYRRMHDVFEAKDAVLPTSCFSRTRRAGIAAAHYLSECLPDIKGCLNSATDVVGLTSDDENVHVIPVTNLRHLLVDVLVEKGFIVKPVFQQNRILLFLSAPIKVLMEQAEGLKLVRCAFSDRNLQSRMPLDPTHVRLKRAGV